MQAIRILSLCATVFFFSAVSGQTKNTDPAPSPQSAESESIDDTSKPVAGKGGLASGSKRDSESADSITQPIKKATSSPNETAKKTSDLSEKPAEADDQKKTDDVEIKPKGPHVFGWIEEVMLAPGKRWRLNAKLDTGADTSSLDARNIRRVTSKGKRYVRFDVKHPTTGKLVSLRRPFVRTTRIRRHSGKHQRRQVVLMSICLGDQQRIVEVTLTDREVFDYPLLLGRSALAGLAVVNPMQNYTAEPTCWALPDAPVNPDQNEDPTEPEPDGDAAQKLDDDAGQTLPDKNESREKQLPADSKKRTMPSEDSATPENPVEKKPSKKSDASENLTLTHELAGKPHAIS